MAKEVYILALDVGFANLGICVARLKGIGEPEELKLVTVSETKRDTKKKSTRVVDDDVRRVLQHVEVITALTSEYDIRASFSELPHAGAKGARANRAMGLATAYAVTALKMLDIPAIYLTPEAVKRATTGKKNASKEEIEGAVRKQWPDFDGWPTKKTTKDNAFDAVATLITARSDPLYLMLARDAY